MREYLLTEKEKQVITEYLETGKKLEGFRVILHRAKNMQVINSDLELIKKFLSKVEGKQP
jgi:hypothetical protein